MDYNILIAIIIIIISIGAYNYFNIPQEGFDSTEDDSDDNSALHSELLKEIKRDNKNIIQLEQNNIKYNKILDCLTYRQDGRDAKKKHAQSGKAIQSVKQKTKINNAFLNLKKLNLKKQK